MSIPQACITRTRDTSVVLQERQSKIIFNNVAKKRLVVVNVDGCAITEGVRCDFLVIDPDKNEHFVELKGSNIDHAVEQLARTIELLSIDQKLQKKTCFIVSSRCPLTTPKIQELKVKFKKKYNALLIIKNRQIEHSV